MAACYFKCKSDAKDLVHCSEVRIRKVIQCSKERGDNLYVDLEKQLNDDPEFVVYCHKNCISTYTSTFHIALATKKRKHPDSQTVEPPVQRVRRSTLPTFDFKQHCLFCGEQCVMIPDPKHPDRWRKAVLCATADRGPMKCFKESVLQSCTARGDKWGEQVEIRLRGALSDLHAADGRYHKDCMSAFMGKRAITVAKQQQHASYVKPDEAYHSVIKTMDEDKTRIWNTVELFAKYVGFGGNILTRRTIVHRLSDHYGLDLLILTSPGVANLVLFRSSASVLLHIVDDDDNDDMYNKKVARKIEQEYKTIPREKGTYKTRIDIDDLQENTSETLMQVLSLISGKLKDSLPAIVIGNMISSCIHNSSTNLQIALGVLLREKKLIEVFHEIGVTCSYDEVLRFKTSCAVAGNKKDDVIKITDKTPGLIQVIVDNFDATISSPNGLQSTHALALLLTQAGNSSAKTKSNCEIIRRISKQEMKHSLDQCESTPIQRYNGPKKPVMPEDIASRQPQSLKMLCQQYLAMGRGRNVDFQYMKLIVKDEECPEFGGFNTRQCREQGKSAKPSTVAKYTPLIDMTPADPDTMLTAIVEAQRLTKAAGQLTTVFTADQQLYRVAVNLKWHERGRFDDVIIRLGGMHLLMSFVGSIGTLMSDTGLTEIMQGTFGGVPHMLKGKKFPQNVRALIMVVTELLRNTLDGTDNQQDLMNVLEKRGEESRTAKVWLQNLIKPVFLMMLFIRAEREGDWPLHLWVVNEMLPYFFAAGHVNYARYGLYYLRTMQKIDGEALIKFMEGEHVMRHKQGLWNGMWSDMFIETTFMRYGHGPGGLIGITLKPSAVKRWALSLHACSQIIKDVSNLGETKTKVIAVHKEERPSRITSDNIDRQHIRTKLLSCLDPLDVVAHPPGQIINIVSGIVGPETVNVENSVTLGKQQMIEYENEWPLSFNTTLSTKVVTMSATRKCVRIGASKVFDTNLIYTRVMGLVGSREMNIKDVMAYELSPIPTSMFEESGDVRLCKSKSTLKKLLQVEVSDRHTSSPDSVIIIDGCAILWMLHWPNNSTVQVFVNAFVKYVSGKLEYADVHVIFDRYFEYSIKSMTRCSRSGKVASRHHRLSYSTPLPSQHVTLTETSNKEQLIRLICEQLVRETEKNGNNHKLVVTGPDPIPVQVHDGSLTARSDLETHHEEADVIIAQQVIRLAKSGSEHLRVICDDTDVFVLLVYFYWFNNMTCSLIMEGTNPGRSVVDIGATVKKHETICKHLLPAHALSGCDTVATLFGIGKTTVLKKCKLGCELDSLGSLDADIEDVVAQATKFVASLYGCKNVTSMTSVRYQVWSSKMGNKQASSAPKLKSLPPTSEAFRENVKRAHLQAAIWKSSEDNAPPTVDPTDYGWYRNTASKTLQPVTVPSTVSPAPDEVLQMVRCGCFSERPCSTARCGCSAANLPCTIFCKCFGEAMCCNVHTKRTVESDSEGDDE